MGKIDEQLRLDCTRLQGEKETAEEALEAITAEIQKLRAGSAKLQEEKKTARKEVQAIQAETKALMNKLEDKSTEVTNLQQQLIVHIQEHDQTKEQMINMRKSAKVASAERDKAQSELKQMV